MNIVGKRLTEFIDRLVSAVRSPEFPISPRQIIDAHDVGLRLLGTGGGQVSSSTLKYSLAPIFCADPAEQAAFYDCYDRLLETEIVTKSVTPAPRLPKELQFKADSTKSTPKIIRKWFRQRLAMKVVTFALLLSAATWFMLAMMDESRIDPGPEPGSGVVQPKPGQNGEATKQATPLASTELLRADQSRIISAGIWLIILIPAITGISSLARRIVGRRVFLTAHSSRSHPELRPIPVAETGNGLYKNSQLLSSVATLRQPEQEQTRRLDTLKTVDRTIRGGGFPDLVYEARSRRPGYVLLIERKNTIDFFAHAAKSLADYLYGAGLEVYSFAFKGRPFRLTPLWRKDHVVTYQDVLQRFQGDGLILAGDPAVIRSGNVAHARHWQPEMSAWRAGGLLSSNASEAWNQGEDWFRDLNFAVAELSSGGFGGVAGWLARADDQRESSPFEWQPTVDSLYPRSLANDADRWLSDEPDAGLEQLLEELRGYLGDDGLFLLAAISAYPELRWPIARFLNHHLFIGAEDGNSERRLLRIARLPWCREGMMPDYIRQAFLRTLTNEQLGTIKSAYYTLLNETHSGSGDLPKIEIADQNSTSFRDYLSEMLSTAPPGPYRDYIFQSVLLNEPKDMFAAELDKNHAGKMRSQRWQDAIPDILRDLRKTAIYTIVAAVVAFFFLDPVVTSTIENINFLQNGRITVRILSTGSLARHLQGTLEDRGFKVITEAGSPSTPKAPDTQNTVYFDNLAGVSIINQEIVVRDSTSFSMTSTPMLSFAEVIAGQISDSTNEPTRVVQRSDSSSEVLVLLVKDTVVAQEVPSTYWAELSMSKIRSLIFSALSNSPVELYLGVFCIFVNAARRYSNSVTNRESMIPLRYWVNFSFYLTTIFGIYVFCALLLDYVPETIDLIYGLVTAQPTASSALSPLLSPRSINTPLIIALFLIVLNPSLPVLSRLDQALLDRFSDRVRIPTSQTPFRDSSYGLVIIFLIAIAVTVIMVPGVYFLTLLDTPFEWYLGGIFVCVNAYRKFNTPATNRSTTTFAQFIVYGLLYCLAMLLIYLFLAAVLNSSPETIQIVRNFLNISVQGNAFDEIDFVYQSKTFISALMVIALLPYAQPGFKNFDKRLLKLFWDLARIPNFVNQQAESLRQAGYIIDPGKRKDLEIYAQKFGIEIDTISLDDREGEGFNWAKLVSLQLSLDQWRRSANGRTRRFLSDNEREYSLIKSTVDDLSFQFTNNRPGESRNEASKAALEKEITATYKRLTEFVARILLISEYNQTDILRRIRELGLGDVDFHSRSLSANQMVLILVSMFASFLILSFLFNRVFSDYPRTMLSVLNESLMMMMTYGAAVTCALIIKGKPAYSFNELTSQRPWLGYALSGMFAIVTWLVVAWGYRYIELMLRSPVGGDATIEGLVIQVLAHLEWSYPYMLQSYVIAVGLSFLVDRKIPSNMKLITKTKIADSVFLTILMMFISLVVYQWMFGIFLFEGLQTKSIEYIKPDQITWMAQLSFALEHGIIGAVIGFLVPHWYRTNRSRASGEIASRAILMNKKGLSAEIRNLVPNQLIRAVAAIAASVAEIDQDVSHEEKNVYQVICVDLAGLPGSDVEIDSAVREFNQCQKLIEKGELDLEARLRNFTNLPLLSALMPFVASSIAFADGVYLEEEHAIVEQVKDFVQSSAPITETKLHRS